MIRKTFVELDGRLAAQVTFSLPDCIWADRITLVGDFNQWNTESHPFRRNGSGVWRITVDLEPRRAYQFRYLVDGKDWTNDQEADAHVYNIYGSDNFVVVTDPDFKRHSDERTANA
ncbi:MAG: isoamylase early set domain-containing protein [Caldilineales bacterium]|nr:isoamylase early set domain-containing protein [Caldilineales bacterium]MCW5857162.1 isoamylase early set domain-containing protein [Caldilineales bacterium]